MNKLNLTFFLCALLAVHNCSIAETAEPAPTAQDADASSRSKSSVDDWLQRSRETADEWWRDSQSAMDAAWDSTREYLGPREADHFGQLWDQLVPTLEETLVLEERQAELPEHAWFGRDQRSNQEAIDRLLDEAVAILSTSHLQRYRDRIRALQSEIAAFRQEIADYRRRRVSAPEKSLVEKTVTDYDRAIDAREDDIERLKREIVEIKRAFAADMQTIGLEISDGKWTFCCPPW